MRKSGDNCKAPVVIGIRLHRRPIPTCLVKDPWQLMWNEGSRRDSHEVERRGVQPKVSLGALPAANCSGPIKALAEVHQ